MSINTVGSSMVAGRFTVLLRAKSAKAFLIVFPLRVLGRAWTRATSRNDAIGLQNVIQHLSIARFSLNFHTHPITSRIILIISTESFADGFLIPSLVTYKHNGTSPFVASGTPNTAASATSGWRRIASSKLEVDILCPATLITYKRLIRTESLISIQTSSK